jgi:DNA repair protein RadC
MSTALSSDMQACDRLLTSGAATLSDLELLSLVLPKSSAAKVSQQFASLDALAAAPDRELTELGVSLELIGRLRATFELGRRALGKPLERGASIRSAEDVEVRLRSQLMALSQEELHVLGLDAQNRLVIHYVAAKGALNQVYATARDVFRPLVREAVHAAIVVHNHPSGSCDPSSADADLTRRLAQAGELVGIPLLDHVILSRKGRYSFAEDDKMPNTLSLVA